jgi:hypothetical protein
MEFIAGEIKTIKIVKIPCINCRRLLDFNIRNNIVTGGEGIIAIISQALYARIAYIRCCIGLQIRLGLFVSKI